MLLITHRTPAPPDKGDRIRTYNLLRFLARHAQVDLATLADEPVPDAALAELHELADAVEIIPCQPRLRWARAGWSMLAGRSATEGLFFSPELQGRVDRLLADREYDLVVVVCSSMAQYVDRRYAGRAKILVDLIDVDSQKWFDYAASARGWRRKAYALEAARVRGLESSLTGLCDQVAVTTHGEAACLRSFEPGANVTAISNGVDFEYFHPSDAAPQVPQSCVFVGALDYKPNVDGMIWFCDAVWPEVRRCSPDARLAIVGRRPTPAIQELAQKPGVELFADVPDVRPHLWQAEVAIAPLQIARGVQNKILEALSAGRPVVASPQAIEGLHVTVGEHLLEADETADWLTALRNLWSDAEMRKRLGAAGRQYVLDRHSWDACLEPLARLLSTFEVRSQ